MLCIFFTHGRALPALHHSVPQVVDSMATFEKNNRADSDDGGDVRVPTVALALDATEPLRPGARLKIENGTARVLTKQTVFSRRGNLNGWNAALGILAEIVDICDKTGHDGLLKVDSDTLVFDLGWLDTSAPFSGFSPGRILHAMGMCYWIRKEAAEAALDHMRNRWHGPCDDGEDLMISAEMLYLFGRECKMIDWAQRIAGGWRWNGDTADPEDNFLNASVLTFGNGNRPYRKIASAMEEFTRTRELQFQTPTGGEPDGTTGFAEAHDNGSAGFVL